MFSYCCNLLFLTFSLQIMSLWAISKSGYSLRCPVQSHWKHRANTLCNSSDSYVCVYDQNERNFREFCHNKAIIENKGYKVIFRGAIDGEPCDRHFYQPFKFNSSGNGGCVYKTSVCTEEGQVIYRNENSQTDSVCRCDDSEGYAFIHRPQHRCYCVPSKEDCSCYFKKCSPEEFLSKDYECLNLRTWERNNECSTVIIDGTEDTSSVISTDGDIKQNGTIDRYFWPALMVILACIAVVCAFVIGLLSKTRQLHDNICVHSVSGDLQTAINSCNKNKTTNIIPHDVLELQEKEIMKWRKKHVHFEETIASKTVLDKMKTHGFVILSGPPGSGKSATAYNTAFMLEKDANYNILPVTSPEKIRKYLLPETNQVFVIDDAVGKFTVDDTNIQRWKNEEAFINQTFSGYSYTKLILTCRSYIYKFGFCSKLNVSPIHFDLLSYDLKLSPSERRTICQRYNLPHLNEDTIMVYDFFPLLCAVYSKQEDTSSSVLEPYKILAEEMLNLKERSDIAFLAIALLVVRDNYVDRQALSIENTTVNKLLIDMCNECGFTFFPSTTVLLSTLYGLIGTYVKETDNGFSCIHDNLFQNLSFIVGSDVAHCLINYGSSTFLANRLQLASLQQEHDELVIIVKPEHEELYFQRLLFDIKKGDHSKVINGIQMKNSQFRSKLLTFLKRCKAGDLTCDQNSSSPLHVVSEKGYDDLVFELSHLKKDQINLLDKDSRTPLFMACLGRHDKVVHTLLSIDCSTLNVANDEDLTPFDVASINDDVTSLKILLKYDANVNRTDRKMKRTALQRACENGSNNAVNFLLTKNANVNYRDINGLKAIHIACSKGHPEIVEILLKHDTNMINELNHDGRTPLFIACENNQLNIVCMLLANKANVNRTDVKHISPLSKACQIGNDNIVRLLIDNSAKINIQSDNGSSPLYIASMNGKLNCVEILLNKNAEIDLATKQGWTPFFISCSKGHFEICKLLHINGANINAGDRSATTPLHIACSKKHERIVKFLIEHDAYVNAVNRQRESPLYITCMKECFDIVELLLMHGANVGFCDGNGNSPLHVACLKENKQIVQLLLDWKADIHKQNKAGKIPCDVVQHVKEIEAKNIVEMLNQYKAK